MLLTSFSAIKNFSIDLGIKRTKDGWPRNPTAVAGKLEQEMGQGSLVSMGREVVVNSLLDQNECKIC